MNQFNADQAGDVLQLHQLIAEWGHDLDCNDCNNVADLCTPDCDYFVGGVVHKGHEAIRRFYGARNERVRTQQKDGVRTQRHTISNHRVFFPDADRARATFLLVNYSAEGKPPALNLVGPTIIADCQMEFRREAGGGWLISMFDSQPIFIGNDPFLNAAVVRK